MSAFAAGSPMEAKRPHLNPGFKVVFASIGMAEDAFLPATRGHPAYRPQTRASARVLSLCAPRLGAGFVFVRSAPRRGFCLSGLLLL
jgi:hypothetical protein